MTELPDEQPTLRVMPMISESNPAGGVFGGWIMAQADIAGGIAAIRRARGPVVTAAVTSFSFAVPLAVGDLVSFYARILKTGTSSITVDVEVFAERLLGGGSEIVRVTEAQLVYVAVDREGKKRPLPTPSD